LTYSSDSTSNKHIEYEARHVALQVIDYTKPDAEPIWKQRTLGIDTSVNHASQTQVDGLKKRLTEVADIFNNSPLAKCEALAFSPDLFVYKLIGTSGDHAADQKKSHNILREWKLGVVFQRLGEEAIFNMSATRVVSFLLPMKTKQVEDLGGYNAWMSLSDDERSEADTQIIREVGRQVFENLAEDDQLRFMRFIRTGCCMHKDLNTVKGGDKRMQESWKEANETPPILLANKDNTAVLRHATSLVDPSPAEKRAVEVSKRGGSHLTMLGGLICRNKDKKKGQQDTYDWFMEKHIGHHVPYPDVSNTRYGTHGDAAATLVIYREHFLAFMEFVRDAKDRPGLTNIEQNFLNGLQDLPTLTELCVLAMYNVNVSRIFMQHVRQHENLLDLGPFFEQKRRFLCTVRDDPTTWTREEVPHTLQTLDGREHDEWGALVMKTVRSHLHQLPHLHRAVSAFLDGSHYTFSERFSDEFIEGGDIDRLSEEDRSKLFFASTNDINEGALGSWRLGQRQRPSETIHKFNASFTTRQNDTESFHQEKLNREEDEAYLRGKAREKDAQKLQQQVKEAQMKADAEKVSENHLKEVARTDKRTKDAAKITETGQKLALDSSEIDSLKLPELNRQLDWHRENEKKMPYLADLDRVPLRKKDLGNKSDRVARLKKAVLHYEASLQLEETTVLGVVEEDKAVEITVESTQDTLYHSDYDDDMI
jgi:hypothetical protein